MTGWRPIHANLGNDDTQVWLDDAHPGMRIEHAPGWLTVYWVSHPTSGWWTKTGTLEKAQRIAEQHSVAT